MEYAIRNYLTEMLGMYLGLVMMSGLKKLFDAVICGKRTAERRLRIDIAAGRQIYNAYEIERIGLICGDVNTADDFTKVGGNDALWRIIESGVEQ